MSERRSKVTMLDIARASGLSLSTVSLALNDKPGLPPETRMKVQNTARELGYEIRVPVSLQHKHNLVQTIGVLVNSADGDLTLPASSAFFSHVISGIESRCHQNNIALYYSSLPAKSPHNGTEVPRLVSDPRIDGLLLLGNHIDDPLISAIRQRSLPVVLVEAYSNSGEYDCVQIDNEKGTAQAVSHLVQQGHQHIAFLGGPCDARSACGIRRRSYVQALADNGIFNNYFGNCNPNIREEIITAARSLLLENPQISAILGCNDEVAVVAMHGILDTGRRIPQDVSLAGFENNAIAENTIPPLTTIHVDKAGMGRLAVQLLIDRAENPSQGYVTTKMHTSLIVRHSVRRLEVAVAV